MPASRTRKLRTAAIAVISTGVLAAGSVVTAHIASAQVAPPRPPCPQTEPVIPGENNDMVNPDIVTPSPDRSHVDFDMIKNVGGGSADPSVGIRLSVQTDSFCRYDYEIWHYQTPLSPYHVSSDFFRKVRPYS